MADQLKNAKEGKSGQDAGKPTNVPTQDGGLKNSLHGVAYQLKLLLIVILQADRMMKDDADFTCTISTEDPDEGKFDDIVFRYRYRGSERFLSIQAKHKATQDQKVSWQDLAINSTNAPFAIVKYFASFLETRERDAYAEQKLVLCTNAGLQDDVTKALQAQDTTTLTENDLCYIFKLIECTCYCFKANDWKKSRELQRIVDLLKESSDCYGLGKLLASTVYNETRFDLNTRNVQRFPLMVKYRNAIVSHILGEKREKTVYELKEEFCDGTLPSGGFNLRKVFVSEYRKLAKTQVDIWSDARAKGITLKEDLKPSKDLPSEEANSTLPEYLVTDEVIGEFFQKFLLVCGSRSENDLSQTVMDFWKQTNGIELATDDTDDDDKTAAYNEMLKAVFDWMKEQKQPPRPLSKGDIVMLFDRIGFGIRYPALRCLSRLYQESMGLDKVPICLRPERATQSPLYDFLCRKVGPTIFTFRSPYNVKCISVIVLQIIRVYLALLNDRGRCVTLFLDSALFRKHKKTIKTILRLKTVRIILVIVCTNGRQEMLENLEKYNHSSQGNARECSSIIIQIEKSHGQSNDDDALGGHMFVSDLTEESKEQMFPANQTLALFGTEILLRHLINEGDDLTNALELLECLGQNEGKPCLVEQNYDKLRGWYIQRHLRPYQSKNWESSVSKKSIASTFFQNERMEFKAFFDGLQRAFRIKLFDDWHIKYIIGEHDRGVVNDPPELGDERQEVAKVHIVLDEAGFGKSTYLTWLGWYLRRKDTSRWIIRFNAIEYSTDYEQILKQSIHRGQLLHTMDETEALRVLFQLVHLALFVPDINRQSIEDTDRERVKAEQSAGLIRLQGGQLVLDEAKDKEGRLTALQRIELRLFMAKFNSQQLVVLFDGFDEVVPYYKEVVFRLFSRWQTFEGIHKIYFTSRPYGLKSEFEAVFQERVQFYRLLPFSKDTRLVSIHIFLRSNFTQYDLCEESLRFYLLGSLEAVLRCYLAELRNTPLFIRMGLDILLPLVQEHVDFVGGTISGQILHGINTNLEKLRMIETFIEKKLSIASVEKAQTTDAVRKTAYALDNAAELNRWAHKMHSLLALYALFSTRERKQLLSVREETEAMEYMEKVRQGSAKTGLIEGVVGHVPLFIHRVFVEYFAADWMYRYTQAGSIALDNVFDTVKSADPQWVGSSRVQLTEFFDRMLIRDGGSRPIHLAAINRSLLDVRTLLRDNPEMAHEKDAGGRTFLHLLTLYTDDALYKRNPAGLHAMFQLLGQACVNCRDRLRGWSALDYAFLFNFRIFIQFLIKRGATINVDTLLRQMKTDASNVEKVLHLAAGYEKVLMNFRFTDASKRYLSEVPHQIVEYLVREKQLEIDQSLHEDAWRCHRTVLGFCVERDAVGMFRSLVELAGGIHKVPVERLIRKAILYEAVHVLQYVIVECRCPVPSNLEGTGLYFILSRSIECHYRGLFDILLRRFCKRKRNSVMKILGLRSSCVRFLTNDNTTDTEQPDTYYETQHWGPWKLAPNPPIDSYFLRLLCTSVASGSRYVLKTLLRIAGIPVGNALIMVIMEAVADRLIHPESFPPMVYLIDRSHDLHTRDKEGHTLLRVAVAKGWTSVGKYLIEHKGFDAQNAPNWCVAQDAFCLSPWVQQSRAEMFSFLMEKQHKGHAYLVPNNKEGFNVLQLAVYNHHFAIGKLIVEAELRSKEGCEQRSAALCNLLNEAGFADKRECYEFLQWLITDSEQNDLNQHDVPWKTIYETSYELMNKELLHLAPNQTVVKGQEMQKLLAGTVQCRVTVIRGTTSRGAMFYTRHY